MVRRCRHPMFKGRHFDQEIIILCVRWYVTYKLSYRDLAAMMLERGISVAPSTIFSGSNGTCPSSRSAGIDSLARSGGHGALTRPTSRSRANGVTYIERSTSRAVPSTSSCAKTAASLPPKPSSGRPSSRMRTVRGLAIVPSGCFGESTLRGGACTCERARI